MNTARESFLNEAVSENIMKSHRAFVDVRHVHNAATRSITLKTSRLRYGFVTSMTKSMNTSAESILYEAVP